MEDSLFRIIVSLFVVMVTSALTSLAYKIYRPSEKANRIAERVVKVIVFFAVVITIIVIVYIVLSDMGYVDLIKPLFSKQ